MNKKIVSCIILILIILTCLTSTAHASASAKVFSNGKSGTYKNCGVYAVDGFATLGYSCTSSMGSITKSSMLSWIKIQEMDMQCMFIHLAEVDILMIIMEIL